MIWGSNCAVRLVQDALAVPSHTSLQLLGSFLGSVPGFGELLGKLLSIWRLRVFLFLCLTVVPALMRPLLVLVMPTLPLILSRTLLQAARVLGPRSRAFGPRLMLLPTLFMVMTILLSRILRALRLIGPGSIAAVVVLRVVLWVGAVGLLVRAVARASIVPAVVRHLAVILLQASTVKSKDFIQGQKSVYHILL